MPMQRGIENLASPLPVPKFLDDYVREPSVAALKASDVTCVSLVEAFGFRNSYSAEEIQFQCALASGYSDTVVVLDEPSTWFDPRLSVVDNFHEIPTLVALNNLLCLATKGARSLQSTTIINKRFKTLTGGKQVPEEDFGVLVQSFLMQKDPRVVIWCGEADGVGDFCNALSEGQHDYKSIEVLGEVKPVVVRTLHPCRPFFYHRFNPRLMLTSMFDFATAFAGLDSELTGVNIIREKRDSLLKTTSHDDYEFTKFAFRKAWTAVIGTIPNHWYNLLKCAHDGASDVMTVIAFKLLSAEYKIGYLKIAHILLNWRGTFHVLRSKFARPYGLVDMLLERLLTQQEHLGDFELDELKEPKVIKAKTLGSKRIVRNAVEDQTVDDLTKGVSVSIIR